MENNTFPLKLSELPIVLQEKIKKDIECYNTILFLNGSFAGSGTFVSCHDTYGVLTAHHIPCNPYFKEKCFDFSIGSAQRLGLGITSGLHSFEIEMKYLNLTEVGKPLDGKYGPDGPDIAFLEILDTDKLGSIKARKSFFDIAYNKEENLALSLEDQGLWSVSCCPEEFNIEEGPRDGFENVIKTGPFAGWTSVHNRNEIDGFDYVDVGTTSTFSPSSFSGASGGGVWKVQMSKKKDAPLEEIKYESPILSGVIFYQENKDIRKRYLRCHGGKTIYLNLYDKIKSR
jgi:hypothetical protein